jgi:hypothetical protein
VREGQYYSSRKTPKNITLSFSELKDKVIDVYSYFEKRNYFQEHLGKYEEGGNLTYSRAFHPGIYGSNINKYIEIKLGENRFWPLDLKSHLLEDDLFDGIEFLYDSISKPLKCSGGNYITGYRRYSSYSKTDGREEFRQLINPTLSRYGEGYNLDEDGLLRQLDPIDIAGLSEELNELDVTAPERHLDLVKKAKKLFNNRHAATDSKFESIRLIADALEFIRPQLKKHLSRKDEDDLFKILNNFGIRHNNAEQQQEYDKDVFADWLFYHYLTAYIYTIRILKSKGVEI